jgi:hypothetical protein
MQPARLLHGLAPAVLLASTAGLAASTLLQAASRSGFSPGALDRIHVGFATASVPLAFATLTAVWLGVGRTVHARWKLTERVVASGRVRLALLSVPLLAVPSFALSFLLTHGTSAFRAGKTEWQLALGSLLLAPFAIFALAMIGRGVDALRARNARLTSLALAALTVVPFLGWSLLTRTLRERYGASQLASFGLVTAGTTLLWASFFTSDNAPRERPARLILACALAASFLGLLLPPSPAGIALFYAERPTRWFARAVASALPDRDGDGSPRQLGLLRGGDCDDSDPKRVPFALDVPENGFDENCFNGDSRATLPGAATLRPVAASGTQGARKNVIIVLIDSLRFDRRFENGVDAAIMPGFARLAASGVAFSEFRTCSPRTRESVPDLLGAGRELTGGSPIGLTAVEALGRDGVLTAFIASEWLARYAPLPGFTVRRTPAARYGHFADGEVVAQARAFLTENPREPFFLFTHWLGAHEPYEGEPSCVAAAASDLERYECALTALDHKLSALYSTLETTGLAERTVLAVSADHGEEFAEHGGRFHATTLFDEILRVPLFMLDGPGEPTSVNAPLGCGDFLPTVLGRAGYVEGLTPYGRDALGRTRGTPSPQVARTRRAGEPSRFEPRSHAVAHRDYKLIFDAESGLLTYFDLKRDPAETSPLSSAPADVERELLSLLDSWLSDQARTVAVGPPPVLAAK